MEERAQLRKYLPILWIVNLAVAAFFAASYLFFTSDFALQGAGANGEALLTYDGGAKQALYRYGGMSIAVLVLQGLMAVLNFGVVPFLEPDEEKVTPTCLKIALGSTVLIMAITLGALSGGAALGEVKPLQVLVKAYTCAYDQKGQASGGVGGVAVSQRRRDGVERRRGIRAGCG